MKQIQLIKKGPYTNSSNLKETIIDMPKINDNEVLIKVEACGVCYRDIIDREGGNSFVNTPLVLGHEISGIVIESSVSEWKKGDRIVTIHGAPCGHCEYCLYNNSPRCISNVSYTYGLLCDGGYQEYMIVHYLSLVSLPPSISFSQSCFLCCTAAVSLRALKHANIKPGNSVVITGASGGVGVHAIQIIKALGAMPICITSNKLKEPSLIALGAGRVIISNNNTFHNEVLSENGGPVDIVLELVGGPTFKSSLRCLKPTGSIVLVGNISVSSVSIPLGRMILFENKVIGSSGATKEDLKEVLQMVVEKKIQPILHSEVPLSIEGIQKAHQLLKQKNITGRVVIKSSL